MAKKIVAINGSPRKGWNTDILVQEAAKGAASKGAVTEVIQLYDLQFSGCISCFGCKLAPNIGRCVLKDNLAPVLQQIREADGLIISSPIYISEVTASVRALIERLTFQYISYKLAPACYNTRRIPVLLIFTTNCPEAEYENVGYSRLFKGYEACFERIIGPTKSMACSETLQVNDYEKYSWTMFDTDKRKQRRESVFPNDKQKAFDLGAEMV